MDGAFFHVIRLRVLLYLVERSHNYPPDSPEVPPNAVCQKDNFLSIWLPVGVKMSENGRKLKKERQRGAIKRDI